GLSQRGVASANLLGSIISSSSATETFDSESISWRQTVITLSVLAKLKALLSPSSGKTHCLLPSFTRCPSSCKSTTTRVSLEFAGKIAVTDPRPLLRKKEPPRFTSTFLNIRKEKPVAWL